MVQQATFLIVVLVAAARIFRTVAFFHGPCGDPRGGESSSTSPNCRRRRLTVNAIGDADEKKAPAFRSPEKGRATYSARFLEDNGLEIATEEGRVLARPRLPEVDGQLQLPRNDTKSEDNTLPPNKPKPHITDHPARPVPKTGFNVILTHCTADFDSLASAVGLAKLWSAEAHESVTPDGGNTTKSFDSASDVPTFVVLPRGAHPGVQRFLALHKHLFPIRSLKSLPADRSGLNRLALVDAQRRDRLGPAESLLAHANRVTVVDHHVDQDSDIVATDYVVDKVGSVSTLICERLHSAQVSLSEAEATLLALGIHADTGSLVFDSTTPRDALALSWCLQQGASQAAIAEHAQSSLSPEQQGVLTQAVLNANATVIHGVTVSTVLLQANGFINGLAAVTQDALELSSSDVFLLGLVYEAQSGGRRKSAGTFLRSKLLSSSSSSHNNNNNNNSSSSHDMSIMYATAWQGGEEAAQRRRLKVAFDRKDTDGSGYLTQSELAAALASSGVIASPESMDELMTEMDADGDGRIEFEEFVGFAARQQRAAAIQQEANSKSTTLILIGRAKAGANLRAVKLNKMMEDFGGGGHAKAASATLRLNEPAEAAGILQGLVDDLVASSLQEQPTVGDFMTSPVLSVKPTMTETQVEDLFTRYDVRALPVVDEDNDVIGLVTYKEVAAAKQRLWNKEQKHLRRVAAQKHELSAEEDKIQQERKRGTTVKGWMKQHIQLVEASKTMSEVESILLENDVGCMPVVADGTKQLVGMVTRTDLLRQHRYYPSLPYHNKGFADSIAARKPIIELRRKLKRFDID